MTQTTEPTAVNAVQRMFNELSQEYYAASASKGFHDNDTVDAALATGKMSQLWDEMQDAKRLFLIAGEAVEAFEELRAGHGPNETYYSLSRDYQGFASEAAGVNLAMHRKGDKVTAQYKADVEQVDSEGALGLFKPEGVPAELADVVIRIFDFCGTRGIDLGAIILEKAEFNTTREQHHGKQF
jgi:NTP pyrophosphatase (non-canonical NTP hydrolase)